MIKVKVVEIHAFSTRRISDGKQSGVNESSLDDRKIYGRDGWAERASFARLGAGNPWPCSFKVHPRYDHDTTA